MRRFTNIFIFQHFTKAVPAKSDRLLAHSSLGTTASFPGSGTCGVIEDAVNFVLLPLVPDLAKWVGIASSLN